MTIVALLTAAPRSSADAMMEEASSMMMVVKSNNDNLEALHALALFALCGFTRTVKAAQSKYYLCGVLFYVLISAE